MANWIPATANTVPLLATAVEKALTDIEGLATTGIVSGRKSGTPARSYIYLEDGVLKIYNSETKETSTITVS